MSGYLGDLSSFQQETLEQFSVKVSDVLQKEHDDFFLLRWLRARDFNLEKAEFMLRESLAVRKKMGLDNILDTYKVPEVLQKYYPGGYFGYDIEGVPVFIDPLGNIDFKGLLLSVRKDEIIRFKGYTAELGLHLGAQQSKKVNKRIAQVVMVMDMEGLGLKHLWKPGVMTFNSVASFYEDNFPEVMKSIFVIRAPRIFPIAYNLVKPFLSPATRKKVQILGDNWKEVLCQHIPADHLPVYYGGTCVDDSGDPACSQKICYGGDVPESYFSTSQTLETDAYQTGIVRRGSTFKLSYEIETPNSVISWEFKSEDHDIGFGVYFSANTEDKCKCKDMVELMSSVLIIRTVGQETRKSCSVWM
ncbi:SEC14-like protein 2 isoform X2 [Nematostella vectensis]|uniref:SEC14-like protein 2 isoform X2 n=1 Tax=Nematostella vectensis TaxID=45351 RepID=UPI001390322F|nr:SEC14-like protein 2 isoform X2 [Nematostella vectensis]